MEGPIVRVQLVSFCHSNDNTTVVGGERDPGREAAGSLGVGVTTLWAPGVPGYLSVPPWVHLGREREPLPLAQPGVPPGIPEHGRLEPGMHRQGHSATQ